MGTRRLIVEVVGDSSSLERTFANSSRAASKFGAEIDGTSGRFGRLNQALRGGLSGFGGRSSLLFGSGAFLGSAAITAGVKQSIDAASDLNEQITKSEAVFAESSRAVLDWSQTTAKALGVSREAALEAAGTFGNLFVAQGFSSQQAADMSVRLTKLASDLASFNNVNPGQVLEDLRSGLVGEVEPLRKYGSNLLAARVQQEALRESGKKTAAELSDQDKTLARISLLYQDTAKAQGDFARTSDGLANQQRILNAQIKDTEAKLGTALLPVVKQSVRQFAAAVSGVSDLMDGLQALGKIRVPPIHIPLVIDQGDKGSTLGDIAGKALFTLGDFVDLTEKVIGNLIDDFRQATDTKTADLATQFEDVLGGFFDNALNEAMKNTPPPTLPAGAVPGFATGLKPEDILGPLITDLPKVLQEKLLDVEIASPDNHRAIIAVLENQRDALLDALDDPRLNRDQRISLKQKLKTIEGAIGGEKDAIQAAVEDATSKRTAALEDAKRKAEAAKAVHLAQLQKIQDAREAEAQRAAEILQSRQFRALGLSATGDEIVPGVENLQRQLGQLTRRLADSGEQLPSKLAQQLEGARKVLSGKLGQATKDSRNKINELFRTIRSTFDEGARNAIPERRTVQLSDKILAALGFGADSDVARLSKLGSASTGSGAFAKASISTGGSFSGVTITGPVTVVADNPDAFLRELQKKAGRTAGTSRGRFPGRSLGLG